MNRVLSRHYSQIPLLSVLTCGRLSPLPCLFPSLPAVEGRHRAASPVGEVGAPALTVPWEGLPGLCSPRHPLTSLSLGVQDTLPHPVHCGPKCVEAAPQVLSVCKQTVISRGHLFLVMPTQDRATPAGPQCWAPSTSPLSPGAGLRHHGAPWTHRSSSLTNDSAMAPRGPPVTRPSGSLQGPWL